MVSTDMLIEWLDAIIPDWFAVLSGCFTGLLGVFALGMMVTLFAPSALGGWMLGIVFFSGISAGYKFWEKRKSDHRISNTIFTLAAGLATAVTAILVQVSIDGRCFNARPSVLLLVAFGCLGLTGAILGGLLRSRYEKLS